MYRTKYFWKVGFQLLLEERTSEVSRRKKLFRPAAPSAYNFCQQRGNKGPQENKTNYGSFSKSDSAWHIESWYRISFRHSFMNQH